MHGHAATAPEGVVHGHAATAPAIIHSYSRSLQLQLLRTASMSHKLKTMPVLTSGDGTSHMGCMQTAADNKQQRTGFLNKLCTAVLGHRCAGSGRAACSTGIVAHE